MGERSSIEIDPARRTRYTGTDERVRANVPVGGSAPLRHMRAFTPNDPALPMNYPGFVFRTLCQDGWDSEALLANTDLTVAAFADPHYRSGFQPLRRFFLNALQLTDDPHLGLTLGLKFEPMYIGVPAYAAMNAATFRDALALLDRFFSLTFPAIDFSFLPERDDTRADEVAIALRPKFPFLDIEYFAATSALVACDGLFRAILRADRVTLRAETNVAEPEGWAQASTRIRFPLGFNAQENRLYVSDGLLSQPLPGSDPINHARLTGICEKLASEAIFEPPLVAEVLALLEARDTVDVSVEDVARTLGYSERALRRQLARLGTSYREVLDGFRSRRGRELLASTALPIKAIAHELGFDSPSNFARSFKRWTGTTPKAFRERMLGTGDHVAESE